MPRPVPASPPPTAPRNGFTLVELLVVVAILGILTTVAVVSLGMPTRGGGPGEAGERLVALLRLAREEAILGGAALGVRFSPGGYRFLRWHETAGWQPLGGHPHLIGQGYPPGVRGSLLDSGGGTPEGDAPDAPQGVFHPSGAAQPLQLRLAGGRGAAVTLTVDPLGGMALSRAGDPADG